MVWRAFLDESVDDDFLVYGGYIANDEQWSNFSTEWVKLLPLGYIAKDRRFDFKMSEMALTPERLERVLAFYRVIQKNTSGIVTFVMSLHHFRHATTGIFLWDIDKNLEIESSSDHIFVNPYAFLAVAGIADFFIQRPRGEFDLILPPGEIVEFCFDDRTDKRRIIEGYESLIDLPVIRDRLGPPPTFADDRETLPLQAGDFISWWLRKAEHGGAFPWFDSPEYDNHRIAVRSGYRSVDGIREFLKFYVKLKYKNRVELRLR